MASVGGKIEICFSDEDRQRIDRFCDAVNVSTPTPTVDTSVVIIRMWAFNQLRLLKDCAPAIDVLHQRRLLDLLLFQLDQLK